MRKRIWSWLLVACAAAGLLACRAGKDALPASAAADDVPGGPYYLALTFDDGPKAGTTARLLDGLKERDASATFFLVGQQVEDNLDLVLRMRQEGHQIGNHTWSHQHLTDVSPEILIQEVNSTSELLQSLIGPGSYWLRPPYGMVAPGAEALISVPLVKWSVDPRDWESRDTEKVVAAVLKDVQPNSIILLHDIYPTSVDAALQIIDTLQQQDYCFVTVEELLRLNGITPQPGVMYRTGNG